MSILFGDKSRKERTWYETAWEYIESLGVALIMALMIKTSIVEAYKIPSGSMENTLLVGDFLLANKFVYGMRLPLPFVDIRLPAIEDPKPGDIIIFKPPFDQRVNYIKRCIAVAGQTVEIRNKEVFVDGQHIPLPPEGKHEDKVTIPYNDKMTGGRRDNMPPTVVPEGYLFVMGDNRDNSYDSRFWGFLDRRRVMGRALMIHWSVSPAQNKPFSGPTTAFSLIRSLAAKAINLPSRIRWQRLGRTIY